MSAIFTVYIYPILMSISWVTPVHVQSLQLSDVETEYYQDEFFDKYDVTYLPAYNSKIRKVKRRSICLFIDLSYTCSPKTRVVSWSRNGHSTLIKLIFLPEINSTLLQPYR